VRDCFIYLVRHVGGTQASWYSVSVLVDSRELGFLSPTS
jgi:hypothetical protein